MTHYELLFILPGTLAEDETAPHVQKVQDILTEAGATNIELHDIVKNRIAYPIKHIRYGYFNLERFEAEGPLLAQIESKLRLVSELLRTLLQKYDPALKTDPTIAYAQVIRSQHHGGAPAAPKGKGADLTLPEMQQAPQAKPGKAKAEKAEEEKEVTLEEIDQKLDKILDADLADV